MTEVAADIVGLEKTVLKGMSLKVRPGEVHAIMGQNGSGKSTFSKVLVGHPDYEVKSGSITYKGQDLLDMEPEERAHAGLFLSFQNPVAVPGVNNTDFLRIGKTAEDCVKKEEEWQIGNFIIFQRTSSLFSAFFTILTVFYFAFSLFFILFCFPISFFLRKAHNSRKKALGEPELDPIEFYGYITPIVEELKIPASFLGRNVNEGFSGGEKKRNEMLQLAVLDADLAILDEIDSGLDIDALREVAEGVNLLMKRKKDMSVILITHYQRLLDYIEPDFVHIMKNGQVIQTGNKELAKELESQGYKNV